MRTLFLVMAAMLWTALSGCSLVRQKTPAEMVSDSNSDIHFEGQRIKGYTDITGIHHSFDGYVSLQPPDLLVFRPHSQGINASDLRPLRIPRDSVVTVDGVYMNNKKTAFVMVAVAAVVATAVVAIAFATGDSPSETNESCPFIYSWDGTQYVFDGEPYGGATMQSLERTDWSELQHLVADQGSYRLLFTNEVDETQHTNRLALLVVDHPPGTKVVMDREGNAHAFRSLVPAREAHDEAGRDLLPWFAEEDRVIWYPNLREYAERELSQTRNEITLTFDPPREEPVWLVANVATGAWGSHMIRRFLGMRGSRVQEFYDAINSSQEYRDQLFQWNAREELYELFPEVQTGQTWERQKPFMGGGPLISESRAVPLRLTNGTEQSVRIRIRPPIGFWSLNSFHLAWQEEPCTVSEILPRSAGGKEDSDVLAVLCEDDDRYLDFPTTNDAVELEFVAPPRRAGFARTVFAKTSGWYEIHLHTPDDPDSVGIARVTSEPGYAVRRAMQEFAEYQKTGILAGVDPAVVPFRD
jgi:hypothetical protein